ncbi:MAG: dipeptide epimerase [Brevefilum sp.]|nr:dipeptide epimerase [Brevefilum sp.]
MESRLTWEKITLQLRNPFRISYGVSEERQAYWIRLERDTGWGEGTIPPYYGVKQDQMESFWQQAAETRKDFPENCEEISDWISEIGPGPAPARCALDLAFHDRIARLHHIPIYQLLGLPYPKPKTSSFTIALDTPKEMAIMAAQVAKFPIIKIKLGSDDLDMDRLSKIREARQDARLWVDANGGWTVDEALRYLPDLEANKIELLEQPLQKEDFYGMGKLQSATKIQIVADESVQSMKNIEELGAAGVTGVNIKLMKVGGLAPALKMIRRALQLEMKVMLGCMIETAIGTTAMAHLSGFAEWLDLDASALITNDPFEGMTLDDKCTVQIPSREGIGVAFKSGK